MSVDLSLSFFIYNHIWKQIWIQIRQYEESRKNRIIQIRWIYSDIKPALNVSVLVTSTRTLISWELFTQAMDAYQDNSSFQQSVNIISHDIKVLMKVIKIETLALHKNKFIKFGLFCFFVYFLHIHIYNHTNVYVYIYIYIYGFVWTSMYLSSQPVTNIWLCLRIYMWAPHETVIE